MDEVDVKICMMLLQDSRRAYRSLADNLEISVNAVHKRVKKLIETKVIRGYATAGEILDKVGQDPIGVYIG